jgi:hypothetical protein
MKKVGASHARGPFLSIYPRPRRIRRRLPSRGRCSARRPPACRRTPPAWGRPGARRTASTPPGRDADVLRLAPPPGVRRGDGEHEVGPGELHSEASGRRIPRVRDARPQGREPVARRHSRIVPSCGGGSAPLATVVSLPTARAARPGAQRRDTLGKCESAKVREERQPDFEPFDHVRWSRRKGFCRRVRFVQCAGAGHDERDDIQRRNREMAG